MTCMVGYPNLTLCGRWAGAGPTTGYRSGVTCPQCVRLMSVKPRSAPMPVTSEPLTRGSK